VLSSNFIIDFVDKKTVQKMTGKLTELTEIVQRVSIDVHIKKSGYLSSTSCKEYHDNLVETKLSTVDINLFSEWRNTPLMHCFDIEFPVGRECDRKVDGKIKDGIQTFWNKTMPEFNKNLEGVQFVDSHATALLRGKKPDIALIRKGQKLTLFNIVAIGELKSSGTIDDGDMGQLENYLHILLLDQGFQHTAFGFLTDHQEILMVKAEKKALEEVQFVWFIRETFNGIGRKALSWFSKFVFG